MAAKTITVEQVTEFYEFLQGKREDRQPVTLAPEQAFSVIYFLQEFLPIFPNTIEQCSICNNLFDMDCEGTYIDQDDVDSGEYKAEYVTQHRCDWCSHIGRHDPFE